MPAGDAGIDEGTRLTLSTEAKGALLSVIYEHVLGDGLRGLVEDVERAVARCTSRFVQLFRFFPVFSIAR